MQTIAVTFAAVSLDLRQNQKKMNKICSIGYGNKLRIYITLGFLLKPVASPLKNIILCIDSYYRL